MTASPYNLQLAADHLVEKDPVLADVIQSIGPCLLVPHTNYYQELVQSILGQQLSIQSAAAIEKRLRAMFDGALPAPDILLRTSPDDLRSAGLSRAKALYVQNLAQHVVDGRVTFDHFDNLSNSEIIAELTAVKGIGEWTVHMFLIFCMGRLDVLPTGDLGIKNGIYNLYGLQAKPTAGDITDHAAENNWHPYESVASWYVWQSQEA